MCIFNFFLKDISVVPENYGGYTNNNDGIANGVN